MVYTLDTVVVIFLLFINYSRFLKKMNENTLSSVRSSKSTQVQVFYIFQSNFWGLKGIYLKFNLSRIGMHLICTRKLLVKLYFSLQQVRYIIYLRLYPFLYNFVFFKSKCLHIQSQLIFVNLIYFTFVYIRSTNKHILISEFCGFIIT